MHISLNRRSGLRSAGSRLGAAALAAAFVVSGLATSTAAAENAPITRADKVQNAMGKARAFSDGRMSTTARAAAADPENCLSGGSGTNVVMTRFAGPNRYETAVCASRWTWSAHSDTDPEAMKAKAIVLARGDSFPDALAGGPLAGYVDGPLLLTTPTALLAPVKTEIQRLLKPGPDATIYLLGSTASLSSGVESSLRSMGYRIERLAGRNRFETAIAIANRMPSTNLFFVTTGMNFPDALAAGTYAASYTQTATWDPDFPDRRPVALLFTNNATMPAVTGNFIEQRAYAHPDPEGNPTLLLLTAGKSGHQAAVSAFGAGVTEPYVGANRFETATLIADGLFTDSTNGDLIGAGVGLANGMNFPDALAGTGSLMNFAQPLLLTEPTRLSTATRSFLVNHRGEVPGGAYLDVFGSAAVVSNPVVDAAIAAFAG